MNEQKPIKDEKSYWLDNPKNIKRIIQVLAVTCVLLALADLLYEKHGYFEFENWFAFAGILGFLSYTFIVMSAKLLRKIVKREEDYYD